MSKTHIVQAGEHISAIAAQFGFADFRIIWEHANNAALRELREDPHVLFPGDELFIPDRTDKTEAGETTQVHIFAVDEPPLFLRLKLHDLGNTPIAKAPYELKVEFDEPKVDSTDAKATLVQEIPRRALNGELRIDHKLPPLKKGEPERVEVYKFDLKIGALNPETTLSGQQARLNNMGYFAGFTVEDREQMLWAIEEFQCDHMNMKPVKKTPVIVPESEDAAENTGVEDKPTQKKIKDLHGV